MASAQSVNTPDKIYGRLFTDVQMGRIFPDNKAFADCVPKRDPQTIMEDYLSAIKNPAAKFSLKQFVEENFTIPQNQSGNFHTDTSEDVKTHNGLWDALKREADTPVNGSSLLALPNAYIVPGGRFREIYYWDSYFTMLGLKESRQL